MYRCPMVITEMERPDLVKVKDLITNKESMARIDFARSSIQSMPKQQIEALAATDLDVIKMKLLTRYGGLPFTI